jgi:hypothetical protein
MIPLVVDIEKVRIKTGLEDTSQNDNSFWSLSGHHPPDPIHKVECTVGTEGHQVMRCDGFGFTGFLKRKELGKDGNGLEQDGKCPKVLFRQLISGYSPCTQNYLTDVKECASTGPRVFKEEGQNQTRQYQRLNPKGVQLGTVRGPEAEPRVVKDCSLGPQEQALHQKVVEMEEVEAVKVEEVKVACHINNHV